MSYELRTYTEKQGTVAEVRRSPAPSDATSARTTTASSRGYWITEIGPLNQVMHLWSYESVSERQRLRGELAKNRALDG
jgi:hypothetical protein